MYMSRESWLKNSIFSRPEQSRIRDESWELVPKACLVPLDSETAKTCVSWFLLQESLEVTLIPCFCLLEMLLKGDQGWGWRAHERRPKVPLKLKVESKQQQKKAYLGPCPGLSLGQSA